MFLIFAALIWTSVTSLQLPLVPQSHSQGYKFDPLLHLPGISPYFDAVGFGLSHAEILGCKTTSASFLIRHAAIYANDVDYETFIEPFLEKLSVQPRGWTGPLAFLENWKSPITDPEKQLEQITPSGKNDAVNVGKHLLSRYPVLVPTVQKIYADKTSRTYDTAKAFVKAFGLKTVEIIRILRDTNGDMDSQIPHKSCPAFSKVPGDMEFDAFVKHYTQPIIARLYQYLPEGFALVPNDIVGMQQLCGYQSAINAKRSKLCGVFTDSEWMAYEYAWDLKYYYMVGHGNPLSPYLGWPWVNTTISLFERLPSTMPDSTDDQRLFLSFTHREVPPFVATALGLFNSSSSSESEEFPTDRINWTRSWKMAELIPFLGHIGIEKMTCYGKEFIRVMANSAPRPIPGCQDGPGASCLLEDFKVILKKGIDEYGDFHRVCGKSPK